MENQFKYLNPDVLTTVDQLLAKTKRLNDDSDAIVNEAVERRKRSEGEITKRLQLLRDSSKIYGNMPDLLDVVGQDVPEPIFRNTPESDNVGIFSHYAAGLSFNRLGTDASPDNNYEVAANILGKLTTAVVLATGAGRVARPITSKALRVGTRVGIESASIAAIDPDEDLTESILYTGLGELGVFGVGRLYRYTKKAQEGKAALSDITKAGDELLSKSEKTTPSAIGKELKDFQNKSEINPLIQDFNKKADEVVKIRQTHLDSQKEEFNSLRNENLYKNTNLVHKLVDTGQDTITKFTDEFIESLERVGGSEARSQYETIMTALRQANLGTQASDFRAGGQVGITNKQFIDIFETKINKIRPRLDAAYRKSPAPLPEFLQTKLDDTLEEIRRMNRKVLIGGLDPKASDEAFSVKLADMQAKLNKLETKYLNDEVYLKAKEDARSALKAILESPDKYFDTNFPQTKEFVKFMENMAAVAGREIGVDDINEAKAIIKKVDKGNQTVTTNVLKSIKANFDSIPDQDVSNISKVIESADGILNKGRTPDPETLKLARNSVTKFLIDTLKAKDFLLKDIEGVRPFKSEMDELVKAKFLAEQENNLPLLDELTSKIAGVQSEFNKLVLTDNAVGKYIFSTTGEEKYDKLYTMFRALQGDEKSAIELAFRDKIKDTITERQIVENIAETEKVVGDEVGFVQRYAQVNDYPTWLRYGNPVANAERVLRVVENKTVNTALDALQLGSTLFHRWVKEDLPKTIDTVRASINNLTPAHRAAFSDLISNINDSVFKAEKTNVIGGAAKLESEVEKMVLRQPEEIQKVYRNFRQVYDDAWEFTNKKIKAHNQLIEAGKMEGQKIPLIPKRAGYASHIWEGTYDLKFTTTDGRQLFVGRASSRKDGVYIVKKYLEENTDLKGDMSIVPRLLMSETQDLENLSPLIQEIDKLYSIESREVKRLIGNGKFGEHNFQEVFMGNFKPRKVNLNTYIQDELKAMELYLYGARKYAEYLTPSTMMENGAKELTETIGKNGQPLLERANYMRHLSRDVLGRSGGTEKFMDRFLISIVDGMYDLPVVGTMMDNLGIGKGGRVFNSSINMLLTMGRLTTIAFNPFTAVLNYGVLAHNLGAVINPKYIWRAGEKAHAAFKKDGNAYSHLMKMADLELLAAGKLVRDVAISPELRTGGVTRTINMIEKYGLWMFNSTEKSTRAIAIVASRDAAEDIAPKLLKRLAEGKKPVGLAQSLMYKLSNRTGLDINSVELKDRFAVEMMLSTNFDVTKFGVGEMFRNPALKPFLQFKLFMAKQIEFLVGKELTAGERFKSLAVFAGLGGLTGIPGAHVVDAVARIAGLGSPLDWFYGQYENNKDSVNELKRVGSEIAIGGLPRLAGVDFSSRIQVDDWQFAFDLSNGIGIAPAKLLEAIRNPNKALAIMTPPIAAKLKDFIDLWTTGEIRSRFNSGLTLKEEDLTHPFIQRAALLMGLESTVQKDRRRLKFRLQEMNEEVLKDINNTKDRIIKLELDGDIDKARKLQYEKQITDGQMKKRRAEVNELQIKNTVKSLDPKTREKADYMIPEEYK